ncbi:NAD(P)H-hydrate dehydratase [Kangiella shandongensis]|uniref:NAD(P)H-hydrate dehydratase n=1 Tax=Kangiella shandongensis TaxID=2763258 RepID=UPI001CBB9009|nr:NAD(P)H-hydrate dehydratase [Kangiella shandongensis]
MSPQPLFSVDSIKAIEAAYVQRQGMELYELMERAGASAFAQIQKHTNGTGDWLIATGAGNNAGDGLVVARLALQAGFNVTLLALKPYAEFSGDPVRAWSALQQQVQKTSAHQQFEIVQLAAFEEHQQPFDVVVDALLGTGVEGVLREDYREAITALNHIKAVKVALDIPTGIYADSGGVAEYEGRPTAFWADLTVSFVALKTGQAMNDALQYQGKLVLESLGVRDSLSYGQDAEAWKLSLSQIQSLIPQRSMTSSKFDCGHFLLIGGGEHLGGAAILSATSAIKTGAGMVSCWLSQDNQTAALASCPEVMWRGFTETEDMAAELSAQLTRFQAIAIGPGLGRGETARRRFEQVLYTIKDRDVPLVVDADGLYWLAKGDYQLPANSVLTPHAGEGVRLLNAQEQDVLASGRIEPQLSVDTAYVEQNRIKVAENLARKYNSICLLKGAATIISNGTETYITAGAHPAMSTAGLGDVLTGLMGSLLAQGVELMEAALLSSELHFAAGQSAAGARDRGVLASEVSDELNVLINQLDKE